MTTARRFSDRYGITQVPQPTPHEAPEPLRHFLFKLLEEKHRQYPYSAAHILEEFLHRPGLAHRYSNPHNPEVWAGIYKLILDLDWWMIYNFIEYLYRTGEVLGRRELAFTLNELFIEQGIPYSLDQKGLIVYRGSDVFEASISTAVATLEAARRNTAAAEIQEALNDLSRRPKQDLTGAIQHAIAGLECLAKDVCGMSSATLGDIAKRSPKYFPPPLGEAISKLYGFASERGRHLKEGGEPDLKQVELVVGIAATLITYLTKCSSEGFPSET